MRISIRDNNERWHLLEYDLVIASCGYETRSSFLARSGVTGANLLALTYGTTGGAFEDNHLIFTRERWDVISDKLGLPRLREILSSGVERVLVDISSMPRGTLASIVESLSSCPRPLKVTFVYSRANPDQTLGAKRRPETLTAGPLSSYFSGAIRPPSVPLGLVIGLGVEPYRAMGAVELLEPTRSWIFTTDSNDGRYRIAIAEANEALLRAFKPDQLFHYDLNSVSETYLALESLCFSASTDYRLILAPSGPKVFTLACLLVAAPQSTMRPAVWRIGSRSPSRPLDVAETGDVVAAEVEIGPEPHLENP